MDIRVHVDEKKKKDAGVDPKLLGVMQTMMSNHQKAAKTMTQTMAKMTAQAPAKSQVITVKAPVNTNKTDPQMIKLMHKMLVSHEKVTKLLAKGLTKTQPISAKIKMKSSLARSMQKKAKSNLRADKPSPTMASDVIKKQVSQNLAAYFEKHGPVSGPVDKQGVPYVNNRTSPYPG